ncbi:hypothetical protein DFH11DRAFT_842684 [Phellopilus nigrolimitatus]|nr:hypothetical protein DFH11DRAFT_842684 [Phellopilus nigrolimitatus]
MRSFNVLSIAAVAAFSLIPFVSAAPVDAAVAAAVDVRSVAVAAAADVRARDCPGVATILTDLSINLADPLLGLSYLTPANATKENITPLLQVVVKVSAGAVVDLTALVGLPIETILASVDGTTTVTVDVIAQLLANVLLSIGLILSTLLGVCLDPEILLSVVVDVELGLCLGNLVSAVIALVGGLVDAIVGLLGSLGLILTSLNLQIVGKLLNIC